MCFLSVQIRSSLSKNEKIACIVMPDLVGAKKLSYS